MSTLSLTRAVMKRRSFLRAFIALTVAFVTSSVCAPKIAFAQEQSYRVEFLIGDRVDPVRKWGHVSLRVVGGGTDLIYDFGRYARMWNKDAEGDPILRIWDNQFKAYVADSVSKGGTTSRFMFASNAERNDAIHSFFASLVKRGKPHSSEKRYKSYVIATKRPFHAVELNCTTLAIDGFIIGFPEYNLHVKSYSKGRKLGFFLSGAAQSYGNYDSGSGRWARIWWPLDLLALLEEQYASKGLALMERR